MQITITVQQQNIGQVSVEAVRQDGTPRVHLRFTNQLHVYLAPAEAGALADALLRQADEARRL